MFYEHIWIWDSGLLTEALAANETLTVILTTPYSEPNTTGRPREKTEICTTHLGVEYARKTLKNMCRSLHMKTTEFPFFTCNINHRIWKCMWLGTIILYKAHDPQSLQYKKNYINKSHGLSHPISLGALWHITGGA